MRTFEDYQLTSGIVSVYFSEPSEGFEILKNMKFKSPEEATKVVFERVPFYLASQSVGMYLDYVYTEGQFVEEHYVNY